MGIEVFPPGAILEDHAQSFTVLEQSEPVEAEPRRIVPDGIVEIVFHYGSPFAMRRADR